MVYALYSYCNCKTGLRHDALNVYNNAKAFFLINCGIDSISLPRMKKTKLLGASELTLSSEITFTQDLIVIGKNRSCNVA